MKTVIKLVVVLLSTTVFAQGKLEKETGKFDELKVFDGISVNLVKSDQNKVVVSGEDSDKVAVVNNNGRLKIRMEIDKIFSGYRTFATVYYNGRLTLLDVNENASIKGDDVIEEVSLELRAQEGGEIDVKTDVQRLIVKSVTGGKIEAIGDAINQTITVNTGGNYEGDRLVTEQTSVTVNAGGTAYINASEYVKASVKAGGTIRIYGNPKVIDKKRFLGGKIIEQ
ncbi:DUF2807 domain-containing protein [Leptobacterium flavescens]|uniref:DUF2807 domain-containing protein n=1 Tax=Leptobacterium flavescens TaxID=472055 RepID=A0A6P0UR33_9FLAO|nr:head GIN domain-containing protein [Leptobacterium flavescens]NER14219.1 DUF2807 domain-containing protein [Leptobacterium flavescens]